MLNAMSDFPVWQFADLEMQLKRFTVYTGEFWENITEHAHPFFELVIVLEGSLSYTIRNRKIKLDANTPQLLMTPPQMLHGRSRIAESDKVVIIQFSLTPCTATGTGNLEKMLDLLAGCHYFLNADNADETINKVFTLCDTAPPLWKERTAAEIQLFLFELFAQSLSGMFSADTTQHLTPQSNNWIERIERLIEISLDSRLSLNEYSARLGLSARQIERIVKRHHGISFSAYLRERRLNAAKNLLCSPFTSIKNVAHSLGYDDVSHFCRLFRNATGQTPGDFAQKHKIDN